MEPSKLVEKVISGVRKSELDVKSNSLADYISAGYPYYTDPMPNLYFTRDQGACIGSGVSVHHMSTSARRREAVLLQ